MCQYRNPAARFETMGKHGRIKKGGWRTQKRRRSVSALPVGRPAIQRADSRSDFAKHDDLAAALWSDNYDELMLSSLDASPDLKAALVTFVENNQDKRKRNKEGRQEDVI